MTPEDLINEKKLSVLEEAAKEYENKEIFVLDGEYTKESVINAFIAGAEWQLSNAWNLSDYLPETDNGQLLYEVVVLCKDYRNRIVANIEVEGLFKSDEIIAWMDIPLFV